MYRTVLALTLILTLVLSQAAAQDRATGGGEVVVIELTATERMSRGRLNSCELTFLIVFEDFIYRQGSVTALRGSVSFTGFIDAADKGPAYLLKVTAFDLVGSAHQIAPLEYAYLSTSDQSYAFKEYLITAADDGGLLVGYDALTNMPISFVFPMSINITREGGGSDISIPIDFMSHDQVASLKHSECTIKIIEDIQKKFE